MCVQTNAKKSGKKLTNRMAPVLNDPKDNISIPYKIEVLRLKTLVK
jgi:hypothetical protein